MSWKRRQHRLIALVALFGMLFQQVALAAYVCPHDAGGGADAAGMSQMPGCHERAPDDKARCAAHCHPQASSTDHAPLPTVPAAMLPATTWLRTAAWHAGVAAIDGRCEVTARANAPPATIRFCTFQI